MAEMISYYLMTEYGNFSRMEEFPFNSVFLQYTWNKKKKKVCKLTLEKPI